MYFYIGAVHDWYSYGVSEYGLNRKSEYNHINEYFSF
jgi:hypothetical protein